MKKLFLLLITVVLTGLCAVAQTKTVTGTVVYAGDGEPLAGATILPVGSGAGTSTDLDGNFRLNIPQNCSQIKVSYIGMEPQTLKVTSTPMLIKLVDTNTKLDEVMVVAYGTAKKSAYTGSASVVKSDEIENRLVTDAVAALTGAVSGVQLQSSNGQPGSAPTVKIRGVGSINASSSPLYVVDGMPYDSDIATLNPMDIESMTVLKDAAAAALYGARGANGVILVTTKKGKEGQAKVTFDARWGQNHIGVPNYDVIKDPAMYTEMAYQALYNGSNGNAVSANNALYDAFGSGYQIWTVPAGQQMVGTNGKLNPYATLGYNNGTNYYRPDNWRNESLRNGLRQEYNLSIVGGTDKFNFYASVGYLGNEAIIEGSDYNRLSSRVAADYQAKSWLKVGANISYNYVKTGWPSAQTSEDFNSSANLFAIANRIAPIYPMYVRNADGSVMWDNTFNRPVYDYGDGLYAKGAIRNYMQGANPISDLLYNTDETLMDVLNAKWYATITPIERLNITGSIGYMLDNTRGHVIDNKFYGQQAKSGGIAQQTSSHSAGLNIQALATYNHTINDRHNFDYLLGYESYELHSESLGALGYNLYNGQNWTINNTLRGDGETVPVRSASGSAGAYATRGIFARINYTLDTKYYASVSYRRDASSRFAPGHRWGNFFSVSAGWDIAKENFMDNTREWLDMLKLKASFGQQGNDNIGNYYAYQDQYTATGTTSWSDSEIAYKGNYNITWETSNAFNVGVDFSFFQGKLDGTVEYFSRQTSDMLYNKPVAPSNGYTSIPMNVGSMRNSGLEIEVNYTPINTKNFTWSINANGTFIKNKIIKLEPSLNGRLISGARILEEGESLYQFYMVEYAGVYQGQDGVDGNGKPGDPMFWAKIPERDADNNIIYQTDADGKYIYDKWGDRIPVFKDGGKEQLSTNYDTARQFNRKKTGNTMPTFYGGFGTTLQAYGFDLSVQFAYQLGGRMVDDGYQNLMHRGKSDSMGTNWHVDALKAWTPSNTNTNIPSLNSNATYQLSGSLTDFVLVSSDYLSLSNVQIGYTIPSKFTKKFGVESVRVYGAGDNVALWTARKGLDPRQSYTTASNTTYSAIRNFSGGIKVVF